MGDAQERLVEAAKAGNIEAMKAAMSQGADVNERVHSGSGGTALYQAAFNNQVEAVKFLLGVDDIDVNQNDTNESQWSALLAAAIKGHDEVVKALLAHPDIDVNMENRGGKTPLIYAVLGSRIGVVKLLLAHARLEINKVDDSGFDALMHAAKENKPALVKLLLKHPKMTLLEKDGKTAAGIAKDRKYKKVEKIIEEYSAPELRTPVGLKLKENRLEKYAKGLFNGKINTMEEARTLNDRDLRYLQVDDVADRKKILVLFGAVDNSKKDEKGKAVTAVALETETRNVVEARVIESHQQSTLATVTSLPNAPRSQVQGENIEKDDIPYAKPVLN